MLVCLSSHLATMSSGSWMTKGLNATRWCEHSASDRSAWMADVKCTHTHTCIFSSVVLRTDFPSSCKNSAAVFGEINALISLMQSHAHTLVHAPQSGGTCIKKLNSYFADHHHLHSVNLNQAVARNILPSVYHHMKRTGMCGNHSSLTSASTSECFWWQLCGWRFIFIKTPPNPAFSFQRSWIHITQFLMCI